MRGKEEKEGKKKLEVRIQTREMLLTGVSALGQCEGRQQKQRRDGRNAATTMISKVVRKNSSSFSVRCEKCDRSERNGKLMMMIKKKKRKKEVESDKLTIRASSSSSFEPVIIDIGDGTNDNNNGSKGGGGGGGGGGGSWFGGSYKNSDDNGDDESNRFNSYSNFFSSLYFSDKP